MEKVSFQQIDHGFTDLGMLISPGPTDATGCPAPKQIVRAWSGQLTCGPREALVLA